MAFGLKRISGSSVGRFPWQRFRSMLNIAIMLLREDFRILKRAHATPAGSNEVCMPERISIEVCMPKRTRNSSRVLGACKVLKNVTSGLQPGAPGAQEPECTEGVHEGESGIGAAQPRPFAAPGDCDRRALPPKADEHRASPDQGRAVVFQHPASVVLHCSRHICWMIKRAFERTKVANFASDKAQTAARLNTSRGFVTKYEANARNLLCRK